MHDCTYVYYVRVYTNHKLQTLRQTQSWALKAILEFSIMKNVIFAVFLCPVFDLIRVGYYHSQIGLEITFGTTQQN